MILEIKENTYHFTYYKSNGECFDKFRILKQDNTSISTGINNHKTITTYLFILIHLTMALLLSLTPLK